MGVEAAFLRRVQVRVTATATGRTASLLEKRCLLRPEGLIGPRIKAVLDSQPLVRVIDPLVVCGNSGHRGGRIEQGSKLRPCQRVTTPDDR